MKCTKENITTTATAYNNSVAIVPVNAMKSHTDMLSPLNPCMRWSCKLQVPAAITLGKEGLTPTE
jgi:hypothetical protein